MPKTDRGRKSQTIPSGEARQFGAIRQQRGNLRKRKTAWSAREDSNLQPDRYEPAALTIGLRARSRACRRIQGDDAMKLPRRTFLHLAAGAAALPIASPVAVLGQVTPTGPIRIVERTKY